MWCPLQWTEGLKGLKSSSDVWLTFGHIGYFFLSAAARHSSGFVRAVFGFLQLFVLSELEVISVAHTHARARTQKQRRVDSCGGSGPDVQIPVEPGALWVMRLFLCGSTWTTRWERRAPRSWRSHGNACHLQNTRHFVTKQFQSKMCENDAAHCKKKRNNAELMVELSPV